jgi:pimeloyl-ACP methyl ester carboxylesterase
MTAAATSRTSIFFAIALLALAGGCARLPVTGVTSLKPATSSELQSAVFNHKDGVDLFRLRGPYDVATHKDHGFPLSATERIETDLYLSALAETAPLVILLHGHDSSKEDHAYQAMHLATWGMHCLAVQLPENGPWVDNGRTLARIVSLIHSRPETVDSRIDVNRIILVGHSFGGAAVAIALAEGAPAAGGILLDPAGTDKNLPKFLRKIDKPVMVIAADERYSPVRDRRTFYEYIRSGIIEVSIRDASHEDAQFPLEPAPQEPGTDSFATEELQITFVSALTAAAFSLGHTGNLDHAWTSFGDAIKDGKFFDVLKK